MWINEFSGHVTGNPCHILRPEFVLVQEPRAYEPVDIEPRRAAHAVFLARRVVFWWVFVFQSCAYLDIAKPRILLPIFREHAEFLFDGMRCMIGCKILDEARSKRLDQLCTMPGRADRSIHLNLRPQFRILVGNRRIEHEMERRDFNFDITPAFPVLLDKLEASIPDRPVTELGLDIVFFNKRQKHKEPFDNTLDGTPIAVCCTRDTCPHNRFVLNVKCNMVALVMLKDFVELDGMYDGERTN